MCRVSIAGVGLLDEPIEFETEDAATRYVDAITELHPDRGGWEVVSTIGKPPPVLRSRIDWIRVGALFGVPAAFWGTVLYFVLH